MHGGKCPSCDRMMASLYIQPVDLKVPFSTSTYKGVSYQCPSCRTVVGAGVDFQAQTNEIVTRLMKELRG